MTQKSHWRCFADRRDGQGTVEVPREEIPGLLGFLAGILGMNFDVMPLIHSRNGFWVLMVLMVVLVGFLLWIFKRKQFL